MALAHFRAGPPIGCQPGFRAWFGVTLGVASSTLDFPGLLRSDIRLPYEQDSGGMGCASTVQDSTGFEYVRVPRQASCRIRYTSPHADEGAIRGRSTVQSTWMVGIESELSPSRLVPPLLARRSCRPGAPTGTYHTSGTLTWVREARRDFGAEGLFAQIGQLTRRL